MLPHRLRASSVQASQGYVRTSKEFLAMKTVMPDLHSHTMLPRFYRHAHFFCHHPLRRQRVTADLGVHLGFMHTTTGVA